MIGAQDSQGLPGLADVRPLVFVSVTAEVHVGGSALTAIELELPDYGVPLSHRAVCLLWLVEREEGAEGDEGAARRRQMWCVVQELPRLRQFVAARMADLDRGTLTAGATEIMVFELGRDLLPAPYQSLVDAPYRTLSLEVRALRPFLEAFDRAVIRAVALGILPPALS